MDSKATAQALMYAIQTGDFDKARSHLTDDFQFSGSVPEPIDAEDWLGMNMKLKRAFPNLEYHFRVESVQSGGIVNISSELKGTHKGDLDLTSMNMGVIPATNKAFSVNLEKTKVTVKENKITLWAVEPNDGAGLAAILKQLDVKLPTAS